MGRRTVCGAGDLRGRPDLALPLRQVRLDHPLLADLREPAAATGFAAVPLRHHLSVLRACDRAGDPGVVDREDRRQRKHVPRGVIQPGRGRGRRDGRRADHPDLPAAHGGPGLLGHHPQRQDHVRAAGPDPGARSECHAVRQPDRQSAQLPRGHRALVPVHLLLPAQAGADAARAVPVQAPHPVGVRAFRLLALQPTGPRLLRPGRLPHPPLCGLPQPRRPKTPGESEPKRGWEPVGR